MTCLSSTFIRLLDAGIRETSEQFTGYVSELEPPESRGITQSMRISWRRADMNDVNNLSGIADVKSAESLKESHKSILKTISEERVSYPFGVNFDFDEKPEVDRDAVIDFRHVEIS